MFFALMSLTEAGMSRQGEEGFLPFLRLRTKRQKQTGQRNIRASRRKYIGRGEERELTSETATASATCLSHTFSASFAVRNENPLIPSIRVCTVNPPAMTKYPSFLNSLIACPIAKCCSGDRDSSMDASTTGMEEGMVEPNIRMKGTNTPWSRPAPRTAPRI